MGNDGRGKTALAHGAIRSTCPRSPVGASMLAMDVNDDAGFLDARVVLAFFASVLAPTRGW